MRYKVTEHQLNLLNQNFILIEGGLLSLDETMILESSPQYIVSMWIDAYPVEIRIGTNMGSGGAMAIARKLFPKSRVYSARSA